MNFSIWRMLSMGTLLALVPAVCACQELPKELKTLDVELDSTLVRSLDGQDVTLIDGLRKQEKTSESARKLLKSLGLKAVDAAAVEERPAKQKNLVLRHQYQVANGGRYVLVYAHPDSWFREQCETIVICDSDFRVLEWQEVGGHSNFETAKFETKSDGKAVLTLTRRESLTRVNPSKERGSYDYSLGGDKIERVGDVRWESLLPRRGKSLEPVILLRFRPQRPLQAKGRVRTICRHVFCRPPHSSAHARHADFLRFGRGGDGL